MGQKEFIKKKKKKIEMFFCSSVFWDRFQLFSHVQFGGEGREDRELIFSTSIQETSLSVFIMTKKTV